VVVLPSSYFVVEFLLLSEVSCRGDIQERRNFILSFSPLITSHGLVMIFGFIMSGRISGEEIF